MAVENIVVEIKAEAANLQPTLDALVKLGNISAKDAEEFKKLSTETQKFTTEATKANEAVKQSVSVSTSKQAALTKEIAQLKELQTLSAKAADPASAQKFAAAIKDSEARVKKLNDELKKTTTPIRASDTAFKSLRTQLLEARNEAVRLAEKFGEFSPQAIAAATAAAKIDDKVKDLNRTLQALNPEQKLGAFIQIGVGISGAFTAAQGAMALFGGESEDVQKALLKVQAALAITQGLNSVLSLKDAFRDLRIVLGITTVAQQALTASEIAGTAATGAATTATKAFTGALLTNPIFLVVSALGLLVAAFAAVDLASGESTATIDENTFSLDKNREAVEKNVNIRKALNEFLFGATEEQIDAASVEAGFREKEIQKIKDKIELLEVANQKDRDNEKILRLKQDVLERQKALIEFIADLRLDNTFSPEEREKLHGINLELEKVKLQLAEIERLRRELLASGITPLIPKSGITKEEFEQIRKELEKLDEPINKLPDSLENVRKGLEKVGREGRLTFKNIFGAEVAFTQEGLAALEEFAEQGKELFFDIFATISDGFKGNSQELQQQKEERLEAFSNELNDLKELNNNKILSDGAYAQKTKEIAKQREQTEKEFNKRIGEEKRKAFIADRIATLGRIAIATSENAVRLFAQTIPPGILSALAIAFGALQASLVLSQPVPKFFKKGVIDLQGGKPGQDSIPALLTPHESVMTAVETQKFMPTLTAIRKNLISPELLNNFVINGQFGKVEAFVDTHKLSKNSRKQIPYQADMIGRSVAKHLSDYDYNSPLRQ